MSAQPEWKFIANLGDRNPLDYGGYFIFVDQTGVYAPKGELLDIDNDGEVDETKLTYTVHRFDLDKCTYIDGILSDNKYHPDHPVWFATPEPERVERPQGILVNIASFCGMPADQLITMFTSHDPLARAEAYRSVGSYHGFDNLDSYPLKLNRVEAEERYRPLGVRI